MGQANEYYLYLPKPSDQDVICERWKHLFGMIDREYQTVRVYTAGLEFHTDEAKHKLPYAVYNDKKMSFESLYEKIMVKSEKNKTGWRPNYDN